MSKNTTGRTAAAKAKRPSKAEIDRQLKALRNMPESEIDTTDPDAPVLAPEKWANGVVGKFYRPIKKPINLRIDADVLGWLKAQGAGYQVRINEILRREMIADSER